MDSSASSGRAVRCALVATAGATVFATSHYTYAKDVLNARNHDVAEPMLKAIPAVCQVEACKLSCRSAKWVVAQITALMLSTLPLELGV